MATLVVRPLTTRDIPALRHVRQRQECLARTTLDRPMLPELAQRVLSAAPVNLLGERVYVAFVDDELCAVVTLRPQEHRYRWDVVSLAAGSPRLEADDAVTLELWSALLEYSIGCAGASGAKRLFASVTEGSIGFRSLRMAGFEAYARFTVLERRGRLGDIATECHIRPQEPSDVWSVHHLYHLVTPRVVQFAEALTSTVWELPPEHMWERLVPRRQEIRAFVLETTDGIEGYCRVEHSGACANISLIMNPHARDHAVSLVAAAVEHSGLRSDTRLEIAIPEYATELVWFFEGAGFERVREGVAMVRHTTAPAVVYGRLAPVPISEVAERAPRGIPSYCHAAGAGAAIVELEWASRSRTERVPS